MEESVIMEEYKSFNTIIVNAEAALKDNNEWIERYAGYAQAINENIQKIKDKKKQFHQWYPLYLYMSVSSAKNNSESVKFNLRYCGQAVAAITVQGPNVLLSTKGYAEKNMRDFGCEIALGKETNWRSGSATRFRKHFLSLPKRKNTDNKKNEEHRIESMLLTELSKKVGKYKISTLHNMQPVKIAEIFRFQMPSPFSASKGEWKYSADKGGGIDILARVGKGKSTKLCVMEIKDEYSKREPPEKALKQGLIYATFIRALLRSDSGKQWWKVFGFSGDVPRPLILYVACVMPFNKDGESDKFFVDKEVMLERDLFKLHYLYFEEENNRIIRIETSIGRK